MMAAVPVVDDARPLPWECHVWLQCVRQDGDAGKQLARYSAAAAFFLFAMLSLVACSTSGPATVLPVALRDVSFEPTLLTLRVGEPVRLDLRNEGTQTHDFTVEKIPATAVRAKSDVSGAHHMESTTTYVLHAAVDAGKKGRTDFRPTAPGDYEFYCTVTGHRAAGMRGALRVQ
jgi:uncharacterized cupredoxin-like copper-binding protein